MLTMYLNNMYELSEVSWLQGKIIIVHYLAKANSCVTAQLSSNAATVAGFKNSNFPWAIT